MEHEAAIRALIIGYCEGIDTGDFDRVGELFAHGVFRSPAGTELIGSAAVRSMFDGVIKYPDGTPLTKHVLGTVIIEVDEGTVTAVARSEFTVFQAGPDLALQPVLSGRYHDRFERAAGAWRFVERMVLPDLEGDLSRHMHGPR